MLERLYQYYAPGGRKTPEGNALEDFDPDKWPGAENTYWKSLLRTMPTDKLPGPARRAEVLRRYHHV